MRLPWLGLIDCKHQSKCNRKRNSRGLWVPSAPACPASSSIARYGSVVPEDNVVNQKVALRMLERLGVRADMARNDREAVEMVKMLSYDLAWQDRSSTSRLDYRHDRGCQHAVPCILPRGQYGWFRREARQVGRPDRWPSRTTRLHPSVSRIQLNHYKFISVPKAGLNASATS